MVVSVLRTVFLLLYLIIVSQGIFYLLAACQAFSGISLNAYAEIRNAIDQVIEARLKLIYLATLVIGFITVLFLGKVPGSFLFITTVIAFVCIVVDVLLAFKFNIPINAQFHSYASGMSGVPWELLRKTWLQFMEYRAIFQVIGFLVLLAGWVKQ